MNYRSQIKAHFGVDVGSELSGMSTYIGGEASSLDISEVVNTNITESNEALIAGKGVGTGQGNENFYAKDWGVLMCIYHSVPLLDYVISAPDPQLFASMNTSFPVPELDAIGLEPITVAYYSNNPIELPSTGGITDSPTTTVGYLPRYYAWKTFHSGSQAALADFGTLVNVYTNNFSVVCLSCIQSRCPDTAAAGEYNATLV